MTIIVRNISGRRIFYFSVVVLLSILYIIYVNLCETEILKEKENIFVTKPYLINTPGCTIENIDVYSAEIRALLYKVNPIYCTDKPLITYITRNGNLMELNINKEVLNEYSYFSVHCCYVTVKRNPVGPSPDDNLIFSDCISFDKSVIIDEEVVKVKCANVFRTIYENVHAVLKPPEEVSNKNDPNVIFIGIDGVSASNFIRTMPLTYNHLKNSGWINLKGYNKVEDNTFPNIIAAFAGATFSYHETYDPENCNPFETEKLEACNFLWKMFKSVNYSTAYGEDTPKIGTFNSNKAGFVTAPTDYYFRPYFLTADQLTPKYLCLKPYCTGPEKTGTRMQNLILDFLNAIKGRTPGFGLFWMNTFSHEDVNCPSSMDEEFEMFFKNLSTNGHLENSIMVFFSDHGFRFGKMRLTPTGWFEERLPFIHVWIPENFRKAHVEEYQYLLENTETLTSPYDLYMTMQHIIYLYNPNFVPQPAAGCSRCSSLFEKIPPERTCKDAGIPEHYCTCSNYKRIDKYSSNAQKIASFFVNELNKIIRSYGSVSKGCASFSLEKISHIKNLVIEPGIEENYLIGIVTNPEANFEATVKVTFQKEKLMVLNQVNRLDRYAPTSYCAKGQVQMYCYCKSVLKKLTNVFCNNKYCFI
ncbi:unnamed protein product [Psylliodes chrysocephalus]|uniref:Uncharacterized protein n=1 Tax=Psylliodes chrysocephalus TaxID=3402493 RepID=A0A9P0CZE8_9CUCU|nr:unnamed protein product [Psylliodes chrysocephala]